MKITGDQPVAGFYKVRLVRGGPVVPVRIYWGRAIIDGEEQDRGFDWRCEIDGRTDRWERDDDTDYRCRVPLEVDRAWPWCAREPVTVAEYQFLVSHAAWAKEHQPEHPKASPRKAVDFHTLPLRF